MINWKDRVPTQPNRKKITFEDGTIKNAVIEYADNPTTTGTNLNRATLMDAQGFSGVTTTFNANGSITEIFVNGNTLLTEFLANGDIKESLTDSAGDVTIKVTKFNSDGSISEVMS